PSSCIVSSSRAALPHPTLPPPPHPLRAAAASPSPPPPPHPPIRSLPTSPRLPQPPPPPRRRRRRVPLSLPLPAPPHRCHPIVINQEARSRWRSPLRARPLPIPLLFPDGDRNPSRRRARGRRRQRRGRRSCRSPSRIPSRWAPACRPTSPTASSPRPTCLNLRDQRKLLFGAIVILNGCMIGLLRGTKAFFIPPLPEKNAVEKFRFSKDFIELRRQALDLFVNRIASHPELKQSEVLRVFLQADEEEKK
ncbi:unnamed protein product, partial [Urochloa humidicola]